MTVFSPIPSFNPQISPIFPKKFLLPMRRRQFLHQSALAGAAVLAHPFITYRPQGKYKTVLIGSGWWGLNILREGIRTGECQVAALCDVDENQLKKCKTEVDKLCNDQPKLYKDYRECIAKEKPDIVINATPDHWHAQIAITAMQNGAHVFLEKPISHTVKEGTAIEKAARDAQRVCVVDFHRRYSEHNLSANEFLRSGKAGKIHAVKAFVHYNFGPGQMETESAPPAGLDWDFYCGPAPLVPYNPGIHPRGFRQYLEFANGNLGDWGPHWFDQILWWTEEKMPRKIYSAQQSNIRNSRANAPEEQVVVYDFESFVLTWEHSLLNSHVERPTENVGVFFYGSEGVFHLGWQQGWTFFPNDKKKETLRMPAKLNEPDQQNIDLVWTDFLSCIKSGKRPKADIEQGRHASNMAMLGMLSAKLGRSIEWDHQKDLIVGDKAANALLLRKPRAEAKKYM
jgi:predicted dehydrogenase